MQCLHEAGKFTAVLEKWSSSVLACLAQLVGRSLTRGVAAVQDHKLIALHAQLDHVRSTNTKMVCHFLQNELQLGPCYQQLFFTEFGFATPSMHAEVSCCSTCSGVALTFSLIPGFADSSAGVTLCICWPAQVSCFTRDVSAARSRIGRLEKLNAAQASPQSPPPSNMVCQPFARSASCRLLLYAATPPLFAVQMTFMQSAAPGLLTFPRITRYVCPPKWCFLSLGAQNGIP